MKGKFNFYSGQSLRRKLVPAFFLAALIPIMSLAFLSQDRLHKNMDESVKRQMQASLDKADQCLNMALDKYASMLYELSANDRILETAGRIAADPSGAQEDISSIWLELRQISSRNTGIAGITLVLQDGKTIFYDGLSASTENSSWAEHPELPNMDAGEAYGVLKEPVSVQGEPTSLLLIARKLTDYRNTPKFLGTLVMHVDERVLRDAIDAGEQSKMYVCEGKRIISGPDSAMIGKNIEEIDSREYRTAMRENARSKWTIWHYLSLEQYNDIAWEQFVLWILIGLGTVCTMVLLIYWSTRPVIQSVDAMVSAMNKVEEGNFTTRIPLSDSMPSEIYRISQGFNEMVEHTDALIHQVKQAVTEQKNAELSALEAQIDPHFLYNTLDTINWKAIEHEEYEISEMIGALADILRYTVINTGEKTTLEREISWLQEYMLLQSAKLGKKLETIIDVPENLMGCHIHKLLLQPFVENAIKHGLYQTEGTSILKIAIYQADKQLHIVIKDNGKGLSPEEVRQLNIGQDQSGEHLGIENVRKRLKLYYSDEADIYFESEQGGYTKVHLFIPIAKENADENCNC